MFITHNTKRQGTLAYIIYKDIKENIYVAVCLNFNLVEYDKDPEKLRKSIQEAALSYLKAVRKKNLPDDYLNLIPDRKYLDILKTIQPRKISIKKSAAKRLSNKKPSPFFNFTSIPYQRQGFAIA